jgi:glucokinase
MMAVLTTIKKNKKGMVILAGDIGATKSNLALLNFEKDYPVILHESKFKSKDYSNVIGLIDKFQRDLPSPDSICLGVAGPVLNGRTKLSNIGWEIALEDLVHHFNCRDVHLINDLEATAYGLSVLSENDFAVIHKGDDNAIGNAAVIAPGTGLGEAGLYWDGNSYHPFATEGGHCDFAPRNEFDFELLGFLQKQFQHVSWERLVCGPGIVNIYRFLRDTKKIEEPEWLKEKSNGPDAAAFISEHMNQIEICRETMDLFIRYLAYESANLVLKFKATGGLFIGGGIAPEIISLLQNNVFFSYFLQSGRLNYLLEKVPVKVILNTKAALLGAAQYAYRRSVSNPYPMMISPGHI